MVPAMLVLRCTRRLLERVGPPAAVTAPSTTVLGDWYALPLAVGRRRLILLASERSRLPVVMPGRDAKHLARNLPPALGDVLVRLGVPAPTVQAELDAMHEHVIAVTDSRSVLGSLNDFAHLLTHWVNREPDIDLVEVSLRLSETPVGPLGYESPGDVTLRLLEGTGREAGRERAVPAPNPAGRAQGPAPDAKPTGRNPRPALHRIVNRAARVRARTKGLSCDDLDRDDSLKRAVLRDLQEIARAVAGFPPEVRALRPQAPWHGLRMVRWASEADLRPGAGRSLLWLADEYVEEVATAAEAIIAELDARGIVAPARVEQPLAAYQFRLSVKGIRPPIWRRLLVRNDITLRRLHNIIQETGGWWNYHLHEFVIARMAYGLPDPDGDLPHLSDAHVRLRNLPLAEGGIFDYVYDFGDHWQIDILLEKVLPIEEAAGPARCLGGARAFPHEDAGGTSGYELLCEALADPAHEEHDDYHTWAGDWEPEHFDLAETNRRLARMK